MYYGAAHRGQKIYDFAFEFFIIWRYILGWFKNQLSSQTEKLMAGTKFSDYLGLKHFIKKQKKSLIWNRRFWKKGK